MKIYLTDGTEECFYTAVFDAYKDTGAEITSDGNIQLGLDYEVICVAPDGEKCGRVKAALLKYDGQAVNDIKMCLKSGDGQKEQAAFLYIKKLLELKRPISTAFNLAEVVLFCDIKGRVGYEAHKMSGFLRFAESESGEFYAPYSPDNDITELLMPHFAARFSDRKFVIHDVKRGIAGLYNGKKWVIIRTAGAAVCLSENEKEFRELWKKYYAAVNIKERPHEKQMRGYMPARYWKFLPEKYQN